MLIGGVTFLSSRHWLLLPSPSDPGLVYPKHRTDRVKVLRLRFTEDRFAPETGLHVKPRISVNPKLGVFDLAFRDAFVCVVSCTVCLKELAGHSLTKITNVRCFVVVDEEQNVRDFAVRVHGIKLFCGFLNLTRNPIEYGVCSCPTNDLSRRCLVKFLIQPIITRRLQLTIRQKGFPSHDSEVWCLPRFPLRFGEGLHRQPMGPQLLLDDFKVGGFIWSKIAHIKKGKLISRKALVGSGVYCQQAVRFQPKAARRERAPRQRNQASPWPRLEVSRARSNPFPLKR